MAVDFELLHERAAIATVPWTMPEVPAPRGPSGVDTAVHLALSERCRVLEGFLRGTLGGTDHGLPVGLRSWGRRPELADPASVTRRPGPTAAAAVAEFCRSRALVYAQVGLPELVAGPFQKVVRRDAQAASLWRPVVLAHSRLRWCEGIVSVEDSALAVARAEPVGRVRGRHPVPQSMRD
jgi:hypothetical protein